MLLNPCPVLTMLFATLIAPSAPGPPDAAQTIPDAPPAICKSATLLDFAVPTGAGELVGGPGVSHTDVLHYDLDIEIVPADQWLGGSNTITVESQVSDLASMQIRLHEVFTINDVRVDQAPAAWNRLSDTTIEIDLGAVYGTGEVFELVIEYEGFPVSSGFGSINFWSAGGEPLVFTLSEPFFCHTWWPAKEDNRDKATGDLRLTVPQNLTVASNGLLLGIDIVFGSRRRFNWSTSYQTAPYLFSFSAAVYNTFSEVYDYGTGTMPVDFFIFPQSDTPQNRSAWLESVDMLEVFGDLFGLYPFLDEKYGIYQFGFGGGMEHQTMTGQGSFGESLTAHEAAHQWWGDMITCATWQDIWLNEGFATYGEALWREFKPGSSGTPALHDHMASRRPGSFNGSVYVPANEVDDVNRIFSSNYSYRKGAWVLHQLRHVIGDAAFFQVLAEYRAAFADGSATTADFQSVAEDVVGEDLSWYFDPWVYDIGAPAYAYGWTTHENAGRHYVELFIRQQQTEAYPIFTMPLDVWTDGGMTAVVWNDEPEEHFLFEVSAAASDVALDPEDWTLHLSTDGIPFVEGPPRVIGTDPSPGAAVEGAAGFDIDVTFHKDVVVESEHFMLIGDSVGPIMTALAYDAATHTASLTPDGPLPPGEYSLVIADSVVDVAAGLALDGEVTDASDPGALPSGEGLPGGDAVIRFTVSLMGDVNADGVVDVQDLVLVTVGWGACPPPPETCPADLNGDGVVDVGDLVMVIGNWS